MKKILSIFVGLILTFSLFGLDGYEIIKKSNEVLSPKTSSVKATLKIYSKKGERIREVLMKSKDFGDVSKEVIVFLSPKDVSGVGYLMFNYEEKSDGSKKDSDNWLYMPAMKKTRRIASSGSESEGNFMGTDFTYEDMGERSIKKDTYTLLGEEIFNNENCYKVECKSISQTEKNPRRIVYIGKDDFILRKAEFFDRQDNLHRVLTNSDFKTIKNYKTATKMKMENVQTGSYSLIEMNEIFYDEENIDDSLFTVAALEKGRIR